MVVKISMSVSHLIIFASLLSSVVTLQTLQYCESLSIYFIS